jgi:hypothetical protein
MKSAPHKHLFKHSQAILGITIVGVAVLGGVAFGLSNDKKLTSKSGFSQSTPHGKVEGASTTAATLFTGSNNPVVAAVTKPAPDPAIVVPLAMTSVTTPVSTTDAADTVITPAQIASVVVTTTTTDSTTSAPLVTTTTTPTTPVTDPTTPVVPTTPTPPVTPPVTPPTTPVVTPPTTTPCESNGRVLVPAGGVSCSYTFTTDSGASVAWFLPALYTRVGGGGDKTSAPINVVIESVSSTGNDLPYTGTSVTFHYSAAATTPLGDFLDGSNGLSFGAGIDPVTGMPITSYTKLLTVIAATP